MRAGEEHAAVSFVVVATNAADRAVSDSPSHASYGEFLEAFFEADVDMEGGAILLDGGGLYVHWALHDCARDFGLCDCGTECFSLFCFGLLVADSGRVR